VTRPSRAKQYDHYQRIGVYMNTYTSCIDKILSCIHYIVLNTIEFISSAENYVTNRHIMVVKRCLRESQWAECTVVNARRVYCYRNFKMIARVMSHSLYDVTKICLQMIVS
jgi:hypothetical protein